MGKAPRIIHPLEECSDENLMRLFRAETADRDLVQLGLHDLPFTLFLWRNIGQAARRVSALMDMKVPDAIVQLLKALGFELPPIHCAMEYVKPLTTTMGRIDTKYKQAKISKLLYEVTHLASLGCPKQTPAPLDTLDHSTSTDHRMADAGSEPLKASTPAEQRESESSNCERVQSSKVKDMEVSRLVEQLQVKEDQVRVLERAKADARLHVKRLQQVQITASTTNTLQYMIIFSLTYATCYASTL
jgi:hypothetical protein